MTRRICGAGALAADTRIPTITTSQADTADKLNVRELKEYVGQLARLLLRLSHVAPEEWPENPMTKEAVEERLAAERGTVVRVF